MSRVYNFSAGPSMLPEEVLKQAASEMFDYQGSGQSVMEMSHRSSEFDKIMKDTEMHIRELLSVPDNYEVLLLQGGGSAQFSAIPLNFMNGSNNADFILTGQWAAQAYAEAQKYGNARAVASSKEDKYSYIPKTTRADFDSKADYVHICLNNTIYGTKFATIPDVGDIPLVADISSCIMSEPLDVSKFAVLFAGAQKNIGPAGLVVVIVRKDMLGNARKDTPAMMNYTVMADSHSLYNTPPCYSIYICKLVLEWIKSQGGLVAMKEINENKAGILYSFLDTSNMFKGTVATEDRSLMNVTFVTGNSELDSKFIKQAQEKGFVNLKGHRAIGGMRASIYNAMPTEGVEKLVRFMQEFEQENA